MKKILTTLTYCLLFQSLYALPIGNPSEASLFYNRDCGTRDYEIISLGLGFYGDYVYQRNLETDTGHLIDHTSLSTNALYLVGTYLEIWDVFATLGTTHINFNTSLGPFNPPGVVNPSPRLDFDSCSAFSWSIGSRLTLWEWGLTSIGLEGQYFATNTNLHRFSIRTNGVGYADQDRALYSEWQIGLGLSHRVNIFVPYLGVKYSRANWDLDNRLIGVSGSTILLPDIHSHKHWGYAVGMTLSPFECERVAITAEGRFGDEKALYINGQMRF